MEATGVYWIPVFQILEAKGFEVKLVNAHHVKTVNVVNVVMMGLLGTQVLAGGALGAIAFLTGASQFGKNRGDKKVS
jgi:hypothetical protein